MNDQLQAGWVGTTSGVQAALWRGNAESYVNLAPGPPYWRSEVSSVAGTQQVGTLRGTDGSYRAALWYGTAESFVLLHPPWAEDSGAGATDGQRQGGALSSPAFPYGHAFLWNGSPDDFIDLHPAGARWSSVLGMGPGAQVGFAQMASHEHPIVWRGSATNYVDLHPTGAGNARLYDTTGTLHVGYVSFTGWAEAVIWTRDEPTSFINLNDYLPPGWYSSVAFAIAVHDGYIYVAGSACPPEGECPAILWIGRLADVLGPAVQPCAPLGCSTDLDDDCIIALADLTMLLSAFGASAGDPAWNAGVDFDADGSVGLADLARLLGEFGRACD
jgi:hypothetical protein